MDICRAIEELARELGLARQALEQELRQALMNAARIHYPDRDLVLDFSEWGFELSQRFRVTKTPMHPGDLAHSTLIELGFDAVEGEELVLPLISRCADLADVPEVVVINGPVMPFEEMVTKRVMTRWLSRSGAARLRQAPGPTRVSLQHRGESIDDPAPLEALTTLTLGVHLRCTPAASAEMTTILADLPDTRGEHASPLQWILAGTPDPCGRAPEGVLGVRLASHGVPDLPLGPLEPEDWSEPRPDLEALIASLWERLMTLGCQVLSEGESDAEVADESSPPALSLFLLVEGADHAARLASGQVVACPARDDTSAWDRIRYDTPSLMLRRGGVLEYPPLVAVEGIELAAANSGDDRVAPQVTRVPVDTLPSGLFLLLSSVDEWAPLPQERDEQGNMLPIEPLALTDPNSHLGLEPSFRRPPTRCSQRVREVFRGDRNVDTGVVPIARPAGPTPEMTLLAFDEFLHRCRPDLEADMRLRPPSTLDAFQQIAGEIVGSHALSADLARLYTWRDGQERRWPPLFLHARFSFLGLEEARNEARRLARHLDHMPGVLGEGCFPIGVSNLGDLLITERGGHGRVLAFLHDGEPEERVWPISDNLLRFLHDEFRARIETHEAPCMLAEQIIFDRSRLRRVSLQSLRRTDLEAAPRGTVILFRRAEDDWAAFAQIIPDQAFWVQAHARSRDAALALLDDGLHRRPRTEWSLGAPDELAHSGGDLHAWAGVMSIRR